MVDTLAFMPQLLLVPTRGCLCSADEDLLLSMLSHIFEGLTQGQLPPAGSSTYQQLRVRLPAAAIRGASLGI